MVVCMGGGGEGIGLESRLVTCYVSSNLTAALSMMNDVVLFIILVVELLVDGLYEDKYEHFMVVCVEGWG